MSNIRKMIQASNRQRKDEMVATTLRLPRELNIFVEELAEQLGVSKQEMLLNLFKDAIEIAEDELKNSERSSEPDNSAFYIFNTNRRHDPASHDYMLENGVAAAYDDPWKFNVDRIKKGDVVFLYENGVGVVAYGTGTGETKHKPNEDCHYQALSDFKILGDPIPAAEVRRILGRNVVLLRTMSGMPDGQKLLNHIVAQ